MIFNMRILVTATTLVGMVVGPLALVRDASAAIVITVGDHIINAAPDQEIEIFVSSTDPSNDPVVTGLNLFAQIGDGQGGSVEPTFTAVDYNGTIWDAFSNTVTGGPVDGAEMFVQSSVVFNGAGDTIQANGLLVKLTVDGSGFNPGDSFALLLGATQPNIDSNFILEGGSTTVPQIVNGNLAIAVPEPSAACVLGIGACCVLRRRWKARK